MSGILTAFIGRVSAATDAFFNLVTLLLPGNGTNGAQNNTFLDSSTNNFTITRNGNTTQGTFSPFSQTGWSNYFNGSSDFFNLPSGNASFALGTGAFTIEAWVYVTKSAAFQGIFSTLPVGATAVGFGLYINSSNKLVCSVGNGSTATDVTTSASIDFNTWVHVAATRVATTGAITVFINGTSSATGTASTSVTSQDAIVGRLYTNSAVNYLQGYISNLRVSNVVRTISVPTAPYSSDANTLFLVSQSNRFVDNGANALTLSVTGASVQAFSPFAPTAAYSAATVGGSGYFNGTTDYLTTSANGWSQLGTGNFTVEAFCYIASYGTYFSIFDARTSGNAPWILGVNSSGYADFFYGTSAGQRLLDTTATGLNAWVHIAAVRSGSTMTLYVNGASRATVTYSSAINGGSSTPSIGRLVDPFYANGYISNARVVVGTAVYTANFTPPTAPLTAITNTQLLTNFTNAGITDATAKNDLETVGNAQISTAQSKFGGSSIAFDGTNGTYLSVKGSSAVVPLGSGDFTIEFWIYFNTGTVASRILMDYRPLSTEGAYPTIYVNASSQLTYYTSSADRIAGGTLSATSWTHIALCRASGSTRLFINGTQSGSTYTDANNYLSATDRPFIGMSSKTANDGVVNGYIDDLRITRFARYTSNFTAPTAAFPLQ